MCSMKTIRKKIVQYTLAVITETLLIVWQKPFDIEQPRRIYASVHMRAHTRVHVYRLCISGYNGVNTNMTSALDRNSYIIVIITFT